MNAVPVVPTLTVIPKPYGGIICHRRYAHTAPIQFWNLGGPGIRLQDVLHGDLSSVVDDGAEAMNAPGAKVSYRIEWPGYQAMSKQVHARRVHGTQCRTRIAQQVAEMVDDFIYERMRCETPFPEWRVGPGFIAYESLYLMELRRVSKSTWVVVLAYAAT